MTGYHYKSCGLDNVYLLNGYEEIEVDGQNAIAIHDQDGLHKAIAKHLIDKSAPLSGAEFRFLRTELDLSQKTLGQLLSVSEQAVAKWEKGQVKNIGVADSMLRLLARERLLNQEGAVYEFITQLAALDAHVDQGKLELEETDEGWVPSRAA